VRLRPLTAVIALLALALAGAGARLTAASTQAAPDLAALVAGAERIAELDVLDATSALLPDGRIETRYTLATVAPLKGDQPAIQDLRMPGGEVAGRGLILPGLPRLRAGERVILFLSAPTPERGWRLPIGLGAGAFAVRRSGGAAQVQTLDPHAEPAILDHDAFLDAILAEVQRQAGPR
jgi:hypothetical protein